MPVDRKKWKETYTEHDFLSFPCRPCGGKVELAVGGLQRNEAAESLSAHGHEAWEPEWMSGCFTARLRCSSCEDPAVVAGDWRAREVYHREPEVEYLYEPRLVRPPPALIQVPEECPPEIVEEIERAQSLFWTDGAACANAIRGVVEVFLTVRRVNKTRSTPRGRERLSLHGRIELFRDSSEELASALMAVKWIGNAGSHAGSVTRQDLCDGLDLIEHVLEEAFDPPRVRAAKLARKINRRRRPRGHGG